MEKPVRKRISKILSVASSVGILLMIGVIVFLGYLNSNNKIAFLGGHALVRIISPSMETTIPTGSYIYVEQIAPDEVSNITVGDVIVFYSRDPAIYGMPNTHRVVDIIAGDNGPEFVTKGDNNPVTDSVTALPENITGRYVKNLPVISSIAGFFRQKWAFFCLIVLPALVLVVVCIYEIIKRAKEVRMDLLVAQQVEALKSSGLPGEAATPQAPTPSEPQMPDETGQEEK